MANVYFQNNISDLNSMWYESHRKLIQRITSELGCSEREDELVEKFIGKPIKIKKQRDQAMPKKPKSSFLYFCDEFRNEVKNSNPDFKIGEIMKELGSRWKLCKEKDKYNKLAEDARVEYEDDLEEYKANNYYDD